ncbi:MAG: GH39 family glycosyl hydrolase [Putridiphycobacter sp.]
MKRIYLQLISLFLGVISYAQTNVTIYLDSTVTPIDNALTPGVFYVPKTTPAQDDFLNNGIQQNSIRLNIIESALNNTTNLTDCIAFLDNVSSIIQSLSAKCEKLVFIFEKMPAWLSSSSDGSPATTPGWYVLNTKPPSNYSDYQNAVSTIVDRIINNYGISNAYFEIWNEPDLGSWTGTEAQYFELYQKTYDAIKSVNSSIPVGGPATNHWAKDIYFEPPFGYVSYQTANTSLIGKLIDSTFAWGKPLDFISWHNFTTSQYTNQNAVDFINQKYSNLGQTVPPLFVSEWNAPSAVRDTPLHKTFMLKSQLNYIGSQIDNNMIAAWQDFENSTVEFHNDYGLLTYGAIHKPVYKGLLLTNKIRGNQIKTESNENIDVLATIDGNYLNVLVINYAPPAILEALNYTLFEGHININQLDSIGYIDISNNDVSMLESIYNGQTAISNSNFINIAINNSIPTYNHYKNIETNNRQFNLNIANVNSGTYNGEGHLIDSTENNFQYRYDSLMASGFTQNNAISNIVSNQIMSATNVSLVNGTYALNMQPNSIQLLQFYIAFLLDEPEITQENAILTAYPNPTNHELIIQNYGQKIGEFEVYNSKGQKIFSGQSDLNEYQLNISNYSPGIYFLKIKNSSQSIKFIKN